MIRNQWSVARIPDLGQATIVITGATSGIGFEAARIMAQRNARLILGVRHLSKGQIAVQRILQEFPNARIDILELDLANLGNIQQFAEQVMRRYESLQILINNAGVQLVPYDQTVDGFERHFGTNYLGHFALTGHLFPLLKATPAARVVSVSSSVHTMGRLDFDNLNGKTTYGRWKAYADSKLAILYFTYELQRRSHVHMLEIKTIACHPGFAQTEGITKGNKSLKQWFAQVGTTLLAQSAAAGAWPILYAATEAMLPEGAYIGPMGFAHLRGIPGIQRSSSLSHDPVIAQQLWEVSESLTGVTYDFS